MFTNDPISLVPQQRGQFVDIPTPTPPKGGMFASGGTGRAIAGYIGDFLLQQAHMNPIYQPTMMEKWKRQQELDDYNRKRGDDNADFISQYQYKIDHPAPTSNDTVNDYQFIAQTLGADAAKQFLKTKTDPVVITPYGPMPYSSAMPQVPTAPVGRLTPIDDGGPTPQASGGFPY